MFCADLIDLDPRSSFSSICAGPELKYSLDTMTYGPVGLDFSHIGERRLIIKLLNEVFDTSISVIIYSLVN